MICVSVNQKIGTHRTKDFTEVNDSTINNDEHYAKRYVRSGPKQPLAPEYHDKPGASSSPTTRKNSEVM